MSDFGQELILDLRDCEPHLLDRATMARFVGGVCELLKARRQTVYYFDDSGLPGYTGAPALPGLAAVQFVLGGTVLVRVVKSHATVFINTFLTSGFDDDAVARFAEHTFQGRIAWRHAMKRGLSDRNPVAVDAARADG